MGPTAMLGPSQVHGTTRKSPTFNSALILFSRFTADDPFVDPPPRAQPVPYLYPTEEPLEYVAASSPLSDTDGVDHQARSSRAFHIQRPHCNAAPIRT